MDAVSAWEISNSAWVEPKPIAEGDPDVERARPLDMTTLRFATAFRLLKIREAFLQGQSIEQINNITGIDPWFLDQIKEIVVEENNLKTNGIPKRLLTKAPT